MRVWNWPVLPVMPCVTTRVFLLIRMDISFPLVLVWGDPEGGAPPCCYGFPLLVPGYEGIPPLVLPYSGAVTKISATAAIFIRFTFPLRRRRSSAPRRPC